MTSSSVPISLLWLFVSMSFTQAYQDNDPRKYSVATVLVRVLAANQFSPEFDKPEYRGFVVAGKSPASLVDTYGSKALVLHVHDQDFNQVCTVTCTDTTMLPMASAVCNASPFFSTNSQGFNPMIYFTFNPTSNHTDIYQVTQEGLLIAKTSELKPEQEYVLEVSLETVQATNLMLCYLHLALFKQPFELNHTLQRI